MTPCELQARTAGLKASSGATGSPGPPSALPLSPSIAPWFLSSFTQKVCWNLVVLRFIHPWHKSMTCQLHDGWQWAPRRVRNLHLFSGGSRPVWERPARTWSVPPILCPLLWTWLFSFPRLLGWVNTGHRQGVGQRVIVIVSWGRWRWDFWGEGFFKNFMIQDYPLSKVCSINYQRSPCNFFRIYWVFPCTITLFESSML